LLLLPAGAYFKNRRLIASSRAVAEALAGAAPSRPGGPLADEVFEPIAADVDLVADTALEGPGLGMRFGMYQGGELHPALGRAVRETLVKPFIADFERGGDRAYDALKLYLLLTQPKADNEPAPGAAEWKPMRAWIATSLREHWSHRSPSGLGTPGKRAIEKLTRLLLAQAEEDITLLPKRDT